MRVKVKYFSTLTSYKVLPATQRVVTMRRDLMKIRDGRGLRLLILGTKAGDCWRRKVTIFPRIEEAVAGSRGESGRRWC